MLSPENQIAQLEQAIAAQESLRATLGDSVVNVTIAALRAKLDSLSVQLPSENFNFQVNSEDFSSLNSANTKNRVSYLPESQSSPEQLLAQLQSYIPRELADKIRAAGRIENERKQVTVLFADLSGFTALSDRLDPEEVMEITNEALKEWAEAVYEYEGYIDKFIGDAIMAVFGAPIAHEDDPERALRAALSMRERLENINRHFENRLEQPLSFHIGINTGTAIAGHVGSDLCLSYTVMGDTVNTASRLESIAKSGQILVSRETYRLTSEAFTFQSLDPIAVKGKREPLAVFELLRAKINPGKSRGLKGLSSPLVGRDRELSQLREVLQELEAKRGRIVIIAGEAGLGKSRLIAEWQTEIKNRVYWLEGRCFSHTTALAYGPFLDLFRRFAGIRDEDSEETARSRLFEAVKKIFPDNNAESFAIFLNLLGMRLRDEETKLLANFSPETFRKRLEFLIEECLRRLSQKRPVVLVIEDMHWADFTSMELVERLLPLTAKMPLAIVGAFRLHSTQPPSQFRAEVEQKYGDRYTSISLIPLSETCSLELVKQLLTTTELPPKLTTLLLSKADGNPFFVEEVIRSLIERGALMRDESGDTWISTPVIETISVPDTLQGVLMSRLDRLPDEIKWLVQQASVIGRVFLYRILLHIAENISDIEDDLSHLEREELIREKARHPEIEYIFKHALTQEVAYQSLLTPRRKELHRQVGAAMEIVFAQRISEFHSILGKHFWLSEDWEKAAEYLIKAGEDAQRLYAYAEARLHYESALSALSHLSDTVDNRRRRVDAILKQSHVSSVADKPENMLARLAIAESLAQQLPETEARSRLARVHYWMGWAYLIYNQISSAIGYFQQVLAVAREENDPQLLAMPSAMIGASMLMQGHFNKAETLLAQSLEPLQKTFYWAEWVNAAGHLGMTLAARGDYLGGIASGQRALNYAIQRNNYHEIALSHVYLSIIYFTGGDMQRSLESARIAVDLGQQSSDVGFVYMGWGYIAWIESRLGNHAAAFASLTQFQSAIERLGGQIVCDDWFAASKAEISLNANQIDEAIALAEKAVIYAQSIGGIFAEGIAHRVLAQALWKKAKIWQEVEKHLAESLQRFEAGDGRLEAARTRVIWGLICQNRGDFADALVHFQKAAAQFETSGIIEELEQTRRFIKAVFTHDDRDESKR